MSTFHFNEPFNTHVTNPNQLIIIITHKKDKSRNKSNDSSILIVTRFKIFQIISSKLS